MSQFFCQIKDLMKIYNGGNSICGSQVNNFYTNSVSIKWSFFGGEGGGGDLDTYSSTYGPISLKFSSEIV